MRFVFIVFLAVEAVLSGRAADTVDFSRDVFPVLQTYCAGCHNESDAEGSFALDSYANLMAGSDSGAVITPGVVGSSRMLQMIHGKLDPLMPPEDEPSPSEDEIAVLEAWVEQGAIGPEGDMPLIRKLVTPHIENSAEVTMPITAIAVSPDGALRATGGFGQVKLYPGDQREETPPLATIADLPGKVNSLAFSRDGLRLLVASGLSGAYGQASIHDASTGKLISQMVGHRDTLYAAVFSPDGSTVATAGYDQTILLWDAGTGEAIGELKGHNGAIFDLAFSPDGHVLASASADETVKLWNVQTGTRLDTLGQCEAEAFAVDFTADGQFIVAVSGDNRLRVWRFLSKRKPGINPLVVTRFIDEAALTNFVFAPGGEALVVLAAGGNVKVVRTDDWSQAATLPRIEGSASDLCVVPGTAQVLVTTMQGKVVSRVVPPISTQSQWKSNRIEAVYLDLEDPPEITEESLRQARFQNPTLAQSIWKDDVLSVPRGVVISGVIAQPDEADRYQWTARQGEVWAFDVDALPGSSLDPIISILDEKGAPVLQTRLQAIRDSYFTFRGKNSAQVNDFRMFNWQEMQLDQYLYASGEVTRLWMHPRGPDSGFDVYPGEGNRWTYFGTTHTAHALGEPAYIVRPLEADLPPLANGLPVFDIYYENDDDPHRTAGKNSRLLFVAPHDGNFIARVSDTRGDGGPEHAYRLAIRAAEPGFQPTVVPIKTPIRKGTGREFTVRIERRDGFDGPVVFACPELPPELHSTFPVEIQAGQRFAVGSVWVDSHTESLTGNAEPELIATAMVNGRKIERRVGSLGKLSLEAPPSVIPIIQPIDGEVSENETWTLKVRRGETVSARVLLRRQEGFTSLVGFGKEDAGRGAAQGVYVDNIGLNGLLLPENVNEREFFLTADPTAQPGQRPLYLNAQVDGGITSYPIVVEVLP